MKQGQNLSSMRPSPQTVSTVAQGLAPQRRRGAPRGFEVFQQLVVAGLRHPAPPAPGIGWHPADLAAFWAAAKAMQHVVDADPQRTPPDHIWLPMADAMCHARKVAEWRSPSIWPSIPKGTDLTLPCWWGLTFISEALSKYPTRSRRSGSTVARTAQLAAEAMGAALDAARSGGVAACSDEVSARRLRRFEALLYRIDDPRMVQGIAYAASPKDRRSHV